MNIYFSGPDGTGKTTLVNATAEFLRGNGFKVFVQNFPQDGSTSGDLIARRRGKKGKEVKIELAEEAMHVLLAANRLEEMDSLKKVKEQSPDTIFIFDRGPADGAVYAEAFARLSAMSSGSKPGEWLKYIERIDEPFLKVFPVDIGICCLSSVEEAQRSIAERGGDDLDTNIKLQALVKELFEEYVKGKPEWYISRKDISSDPNTEVRISKRFNEIRRVLTERIPGLKIDANEVAPSPSEGKRLR